MSENNGLAGGFVMGDGLPQGEATEPYPGFAMSGNGNPEFVYLPKGASIYPQKRILVPTEDDLRKMIEDAVQRALYPGGTIDGHEHRRVEMVEESGKRWRGVLYLVDEHATDPELPVAKEEHRG